MWTVNGSLASTPQKRYARPTSAIYSLRDMPVNESMESLLTTRKDLNMAKLEESAVAINGMLNQSIKENKTIKAQLETQINKQVGRSPARICSFRVPEVCLVAVRVTHLPTECVNV